VLLLSTFTSVATAFSKRGLIPHRLVYDDVRGYLGKQAYRDLNSGVFSLLWLTPPPKSHNTETADNNRRWNEITRWIHLADRMAIPVVVYGTGEYITNIAPLRTLMSEGILKKSRHAWCNYDDVLLTYPTSTSTSTSSAPSSSSPSPSPTSKQTLVLSTFRMASNPCQCGRAAADHQQHNKGVAHIPGRIRLLAEQAVLQHILRHMLLVTPRRAEVPLRVPESESKQSESKQPNSIATTTPTSTTSTSSSPTRQRSSAQQVHWADEARQEAARDVIGTEGLGSPGPMPEEPNADRAESVQQPAAAASISSSSASSSSTPPTHQPHSTAGTDDATTDATPTYPTDSRERQKEAEKQQKLLNPQAKKRPTR